MVNSLTSSEIDPNASYLRRGSNAIQGFTSNSILRSVSYYIHLGSWQSACSDLPLLGQWHIIVHTIGTLRIIISCLFLPLEFLIFSILLHALIGISLFNTWPFTIVFLIFF